MTQMLFNRVGVRILSPVAFWLAVLATAVPLFAAEPATRPTFNARQLGAAGDGKTLDTAALQKAIDTAVAGGGGTVLLPKGVYLSGALRLGSGVTLRLEADAVLQAAPDPALFPPVKSRWEGTEAEYPSPLLAGDDCRDVTLCGAGTLAGQVRTVLFRNCTNLRIEGLTLICRLRWTLHLLYCDTAVIENCRFTTSGANTDGIDPDSSRNIVIRKCYFKTGDDCIAIKSGKNAQGLKLARPSENITIADCIMEGGHGAISIGSEMSGGVRNVKVSGCDISGCGSGIRLKTRKGRGGFIEDLAVSDCRIRNVGTAILVDMKYIHNAGADLVPGDAGIPRLRRLAFTDITGAGSRTAFSLVGLPDSLLTDLTLKNVKLTATSAGRIENARNVVFENVTLDAGQTNLKLDNVQGAGLPADR